MPIVTALEATVSSGLTQILTDAGATWTSVLSWVGDTLDVIVAEPLLMATFGVMLGGSAIGIISRLIRR